MANNRLYLCAIDDDDNVAEVLMIAKHFNGPWEMRATIEEIDSFLVNAFINRRGIALKDEYMAVPFPEIWLYNDWCESPGHWEFVKEEEYDEEER